MRAEIKDLEDALTRIDRGTFGICGLCGKEIPRERLEYQLTAETCVACLNRVAR